MFIQTEATPNPETLKFFPGRVILSDGVAAEFHNAESAAGHSPLAAQLLTISGVSSVFFGNNFIAVSKNTGEWEHLKPAILGIIMDYLMSESSIVLAPKSDRDGTEEFFNSADKELVKRIKVLIEERVRPAVSRDGGDITFRGFENGIVYLNLRGACAGCPSSTATLKRGIENLLRHFIPEIQGVEAFQ
ncbi:MAG: NifU domain-containing protein [Candidatus Tokpelaia sp. JSC085]|nr:MAG: NifU domain-containing protein [Candidatus Tokpelaia sp. JSC085]